MQVTQLRGSDFLIRERERERDGNNHSNLVDLSGWRRIRHKAVTAAPGPPGTQETLLLLLCTHFQFGVRWPALHSPPSFCLWRPHGTVSTLRFLFCSLPMCQKRKFGDCIWRRWQLLQSKWTRISSLLTYRLLIGVFRRCVGLGTWFHDIITFRFLHFKQISVDSIWVHIKYVMHTHQ